MRYLTAKNPLAHDPIVGYSIPVRPKRRAVFEAKKMFSTALATVGLCIATSAVAGAVLSRAEPVLIEKRMVALSASMIGKQGLAAYGAQLSPAALRAGFGVPASRAE